MRSVEERAKVATKAVLADMAEQVEAGFLAVLQDMEAGAGLIHLPVILANVIARLEASIKELADNFKGAAVSLSDPQLANAQMQDASRSAFKIAALSVLLLGLTSLLAGMFNDVTEDDPPDTNTPTAG